MKGVVLMGLLDRPGAQEQPLRVVVRRTPSVLVLVLHGELDMHTRTLLTGELDKVLAQSVPYPPGVIVDLSKLAFCDSSGLSALIGIRHQMMAAGRPLALAGAHDNVEQILYRTGLDRVFRCYPTLTDAENALLGRAHPCPPLPGGSPEPPPGSRG
ncbi:STAS domain-containing protein [Nonomuraea sp. NPDC049152]|uniref:STAS domain-containing protein n=1 Tax=Nonomuraea sp. NPDC049152 TaxID=3154350 RepID=UPI0033F39B4F